MPYRYQTPQNTFRRQYTDQTERLSAGSRIVMVGIVTLLISLIGYLTLVRFDQTTAVLGMGLNLALFLAIVGMRFRGYVSHRRAIGMVIALSIMWLVIIGMFIVALL